MNNIHLTFYNYSRYNRLTLIFGITGLLCQLSIDEFNLFNRHFNDTFLFMFRFYSAQFFIISVFGYSFTSPDPIFIDNNLFK